MRLLRLRALLGVLFGLFGLLGTLRTDLIAAVGHGLALSNSFAAVGHRLALSNSFAAVGHGLDLSNSFGPFCFQLLRFGGDRGDLHDGKLASSSPSQPDGPRQAVGRRIWPKASLTEPSSIGLFSYLDLFMWQA